MSDDDAHDAASRNKAPDGSYLVGKGRPPESGKFRKGDGRPRGQRPKGTKNFATDFAEELAGKMTASINGKPHTVTRQRAIIKRLVDNACRGQNPAIQMALTHAQQVEEAARSAGGRAVSVSDQAIVDAYIRRRLRTPIASGDGDPVIEGDQIGDEVNGKSGPDDGG